MIISAGLEAVPGIRLAKNLGLNVVVSDSNPNAPGFKYADHSLIASTYDVESTLEAALDFEKREKKIDGVMCIASDVPLTVATIANRLKLPGITIEAAKLAMNKLLMKEKFQSDGVPIPWFSSINSFEQLRELNKNRNELLILKPVDSRGSRGVIRLVDNIDSLWAYENSTKYSPTKQLIVENYIQGPQISTETLMINGIAYTPGFSDRNYEFLEKYSPHVIENGGQLPSTLNNETKKSVHLLIQKAANSMGIYNGVVKGDIVINKEKPYVIELAARLSGGYFCTHEIPLNTGVDLVGAAIRQSLGEEIDPLELKPKFNRPVVQRYIFPNPGKVTSISYPKWIENDPNICFFELRINKNDIVQPILNHPARAGVVITTGSEISEAIMKAENVISSIKINTENQGL